MGSKITCFMHDLYTKVNTKFKIFRLAHILTDTNLDLICG